MFCCHEIDFSIGSRFKKIFEPSSGKIGKRLNMAKDIFRLMKVINGDMVQTGKMADLSIREVRKARIKLLAGPAKETKISSLLGFWKLLVSIGTGLPQPILRNKTAKRPRGSMCFVGFRLRRP